MYGLECIWEVNECVVKVVKTCEEWSEHECQFRKDWQSDEYCHWHAGVSTCVVETPAPATAQPSVAPETLVPDAAPATSAPKVIDLNKELEDSADTLATAVIVVLIVGTLALVLIGGACVYCCVRSQSRNQAAKNENTRRAASSAGASRGKVASNNAPNPMTEFSHQPQGQQGRAAPNQPAGLDPLDVV